MVGVLSRRRLQDRPCTLLWDKGVRAGEGLPRGGWGRGVKLGSRAGAGALT